MTGEDIYDVIEYGAVSYWAEVGKTSSLMFRVAPVDAGEFEETSVLFTSLLPAAKRLATGGYANSEITRDIKQALNNNDPGMIDATCADVILQMAMFGEVVYG